MKWQDLFKLDSYGNLILLTNNKLSPESRKEALELSIAKWEAMIALEAHGDGGTRTCGMCALYKCSSANCRTICGVDCNSDDSPYGVWYSDQIPENARAVLNQLHEMYINEFQTRQCVVCKKTILSGELVEMIHKPGNPNKVALVHQHHVEYFIDGPQVKKNEWKMFEE